MSNAVILASFHPQSWLHTWEDILKKPEELFLSTSIQNIVEYLLRVTENKKSIGNGTYEYQLIKLLQYYLSNSTLELTLILKTKPIAVRSLENLLANNNYNLKQLRRYLKEIALGYESKKFLTSIKHLFFDSIKDPTKLHQMRIGTYFLIRQLLKSYSQEELKKLPAKIFNYSFIESYKDEISIKIINNNTLSSEYKKLLEFTVDAINTNIQLIRNEKSSTWKNYVSYNGVYWNRDEYYLIYEAIRKLEGNSDLRKFINSEKTIKKENLHKFLKKESISSDFEDIITTFFEKIYLNLFLSCTSSIKPFDFNSEFSLHQYNKLFSQIMQQIIYEDIPSNLRPGFTFGVAQSFYWTIGKEISSRITSRIKKIISQESKYFSKALENFILNQRTVNNNDNCDLDIFSQMLCNFRFKTELSKYIESIVERNLDVIIKTMTEINKKDPSLCFSKTISLQLNSLFNEIRSRSTSPTFPANMSKKIIELLFRELFREINKPHNEYRVIYLVGDIDCDGKIIKIGNATFYDSRIWDFGEYKEFDLQYDSPLATSNYFKSAFLKYDEFVVGDKKFERRRNSARAFVDVKAKDADSAIHKAMIPVREAIDVMVYSSSSISRSGSNPQLPSHYFIIDKERPFTFGRLGPNPESSDMLKIDMEYERIIEFYQDIINTKDGKFEDHIIRAIAWFRTGRWENIPHEKFLSYWIALEEIVLSDSIKDQKKNLLKLLPRLTISWRKTGYAYVIGRYLVQIYSNIEKDLKLKNYLNTNTLLRGWKINSQLILQNLHLLKNQCKAKTKNSIERLENHLSSINIIDLKNEIATLRNEQKFKTAILYERRNSLVHEGITYSPEMELLCNALKSILVDALDPVMRLKHKKTITQIISAYNSPYQIGYRNLF